MTRQQPTPNEQATPTDLAVLLAWIRNPILGSDGLPPVGVLDAADRLEACAHDSH